MKLRMNLQIRSILMIALLLFLALSINTSILTYIAYDKYKKAMLSSTITTGGDIEHEVQKALNLGLELKDIGGINEALKNYLAKDKTLAYGMITDMEGNVLFHSDESMVGKKLSDGITVKSLAMKGKDLIQSGASVYDVALPVVNAEKKNAGILRMGVKARVLRAQLYKLLGWALGVSALSFTVFSTLVYIAVSRFITSPIMDMEKAAGAIAGGDLTEEIKAGGKDEIFSLGAALRNMAASLRDVITKIRDLTSSVSVVSDSISRSSSKVLGAADVQKNAIDQTAVAVEETNNAISSIAVSSENLTKSAEDASSAVAEITQSISRVSENASFFSESAQETASSIEEMIASIKEIAKSLDMLTASSEETASALLEVNATIKEIQQSADESVRLAEKVSLDASEKGMTAINSAVKGMEEIKDKVGSLASAINRLGGRSEEIGQILTVIDDVADQTNLLALNAAILAAQAGEHGTAFAVVADEIKKLAERTSSSTQEIANLIAFVQAETKSSVEMTVDGIKAVENGIKYVNGVNIALKGIYDSSVVSTEMARAIQRGTQEEANVIRQITDSIKNMSDQIEHISRATKEHSRGSKLIADATERIKELSIQIKSATSEQLGGSKQISNISENVFLQAGQISKAITHQKEKSTAIARSIEQIQSTTSELYESSKDMDMAVNSIKEASLSLIEEIKKFSI